MDAEDLLLREFLGIRRPEATERSARWIGSQQRADGSWAKFYGGPGDLSTTIEAYVALRLAGDSPDAGHMQAASAFIRAKGGLEKARVFTHIWLALFGAWPWEQVPVLPPELMFLPPSVPLNPYDFACWARQTVVALMVVLSYRPQRPLTFGLEELRGQEPWSPPTARSNTDRALLAADRLLQRYHHHPAAPLRELALTRAERRDRRPPGGRRLVGRDPAAVGVFDAGPAPPRLCPRSPGDEARARGARVIHDQGRVPAPGGVSVAGLGHGAGRRGAHRRGRARELPGGDPRGRLAAGRGDQPAGRLVERWPGLASGGWAFEFENVNYPDIDDTAEVVLALLRVDHPDPARLQAAVHRATSWLEGMQSSDGGWAAFDADNCRDLIRDLPFCDFGEVIDPPSADVTAHALEMLGAPGPDQVRSGAARAELLAAGSQGEGRFVVLKVGLEPHLRHRGRGARADRRRNRVRLSADPPGRGVAGGPSEP